MAQQKVTILRKCVESFLYSCACIIPLALYYFSLNIFWINLYGFVIITLFTISIIIILVGVLAAKKAFNILEHGDLSTHEAEKILKTYYFMQKALYENRKFTYFHMFSNIAQIIVLIYFGFMWLITIMTISLIFQSLFLLFASAFSICPELEESINV